MLLEHDDHRVVGAANVSEIHAQLGRITPDAILMDVHLPDGDGLDVVENLRSDPRFADVRIYAVTANLMREARERAREVGCDGFFEKPLDTESLLKTLRA
jgi:CheY-like chemotaxis protein